MELRIDITVPDSASVHAGITEESWSLGLVHRRAFPLRVALETRCEAGEGKG